MSSREAVQPHEIEIDRTLPLSIGQTPDTSIETCCGKSYTQGTLICPACGTLFHQNGSKTTWPVQQTDVSSVTKKSTGGLLLNGPTPIYLQINEMQIPLSDNPDVVIGWMRSTSPDSKFADINLIEFGAIEKGVSRQHIHIKRFCNMLYVTDLGSTNGTTLNGSRLPPHQTRILHSHDKLQLGLLKMTIYF